MRHAFVLSWKTAGTAAAIPVLAVAGWVAIAAIAVVTAIVVGAACWAISDNDRTNRLARIIRALRRSERRPAIRATPRP